MSDWHRPAVTGVHCVDGIPSYPGVSATTAVVWLATLACAGTLAWLYQYQGMAEADWDDLELPDFVNQLERSLLKNRVPDHCVLDWATSMDLPTEFWDEFTHVYAELSRCSGDKKELFFDFWNWAQKLPNPPKPPVCWDSDEPPLFNLGIVIPYATLAKIGLGNIAEWRDQDDKAYETLAPGLKTNRILPQDKSDSKVQKGKAGRDSRIFVKPAKAKKKGKPVKDTSFSLATGRSSHSSVEDPSKVMTAEEPSKDNAKSRFVMLSPAAKKTQAGDFSTSASFETAQDEGLPPTFEEEDVLSKSIKSKSIKNMEDENSKSMSKKEIEEEASSFRSSVHGQVSSTESYQ